MQVTTVDDVRHAARMAICEPLSLSIEQVECLGENLLAILPLVEAFCDFDGEKYVLSQRKIIIQLQALNGATV